MRVDSRRSDSLAVGEALLVCLFLSTVIATFSTWIFYWVEGLHYASMFGSPRDVAWLLIRYWLGFSISGLVGWALVRVFSGPDCRRLSTLIVLACCCVPVLIGFVATRPMLVDRGVMVGGFVASLALVPALVYAARPQNPIAGRCALLLSIAAPVALTSLNLLAWLRPSEFDDARGLALAAAVCLGAGVLPMPILIALQAARAEERIRRLGVSFAVVGVAFAATIAVPRAWVSPIVTAEAQGRVREPSVLLIVVDTLRADVVSGFGADAASTPAIHALARDSVAFPRTMSAAPWTTPSFASILSSTYPSEHRAGSRDEDLGYKHALVDRLATLPGALRDHGYWTGSVLSNAYLGRRFGLSRGFSAYENILAVEWAHPFLVGLAQVGWLEIPPFVRAPQQTERVLGMIRRGIRSGRPFFVLAHYMDPHLPYRRRSNEAPLHKAAPKPYRDEVAALDAGIGSLMRQLKRDGVYDEMLIVLTADHGEELEENRSHGDFGHGHSMFDEVLHVPLLVKLPRRASAGERRDEMASLIDVAPTILDLVGVEIPADFRGRSLFSRESGERMIFSERTLYGPERKSVMLGSRKVVLDLENADQRRFRGYDLAVDPGETRPIDPTDPSYRPLVAALEEFAAGDVDCNGADRAEFDPRLRQRLEALGYAE